MNNISEILLNTIFRKIYSCLTALIINLKLGSSKRPYIRLFEHLYVEIANTPSCSAFGYTNRSEKKQKYLVPFSIL